jgi:hypothetical protein
MRTKLVAVVLGAVVLAMSGARAAPPLPLDVAGMSLTASAPETYTAGTPITVSGRLLAYAHLPIVFETAQPVPQQRIDVFVDGTLATSTTTNGEGVYNAELRFDAEPPVRRSIRAVAFDGTALRTSSAPVETRLARVLIGMRIDPATLSLAQGESAQLQAIGEFDDGRTSAVTARATWSSSDATTVVAGNGAEDKGRVVAVKSGEATIVATLDGVSATASVRAD